MTTLTVNPDLLERIGQIKSLPTPPLVLSQINRVLNDPDTSANDIAEIVAEDPAIAAKILRLANSAFYALVKPASSVRQAIVILGIEVVRSLVICAAVVDAFTSSREDADYQDTFWRHSLATGCAARYLLTRDHSSQGVIAGEEGFTAGILHDIGKMVLVCCLPEDRARLRAHPDFGRLEDRLVERDTLGVTHAEVGGFLGIRWNLPQSLCAAIEHHHDLEVDNAPNPRLVRAIHVADYLAHMAAQAGRVPTIIPELDWEVAAEFGLNEENAPESVDRVHAEYGRSGTFLQMVRDR